MYTTVRVDKTPLPSKGGGGRYMSYILRYMAKYKTECQNQVLFLKTVATILLSYVAIYRSIFRKWRSFPFPLQRGGDILSLESSNMPKTRSLSSKLWPQYYLFKMQYQGLFQGKSRSFNSHLLWRGWGEFWAWNYQISLNTRQIARNQVHIFKTVPTSPFAYVAISRSIFR